MIGGLIKSPHSESIPFDPTGSTLSSELTGPAIRELASLVNTSASPGFSFGRSGNIPSSTWLQCETVPSNIAGRFVYISNAVVKKVFVANEIISTFDIDVHYHTGGGVGMTSLGVVSVIADYGGAFSVNWSVPSGAYLALQLSSGSAKNVVAGLELRGTN